jgi:hypothetical protein
MGMHLIGMHLIGMHLIGMHLIGMHLTGMYLTGVHLTGVHPAVVTDRPGSNRPIDPPSHAVIGPDNCSRTALGAKGIAVAYLYAGAFGEIGGGCPPEPDLQCLRSHLSYCCCPCNVIPRARFIAFNKDLWQEVEAEKEEGDITLYE